MGGGGGRWGGGVRRRGRNDGGRVADRRVLYHIQFQFISIADLL